MIVDVKKYLFVGLEKERDAFFREAQRIGIIQFIDTLTPQGVSSLPKDISRLVEALKILKSHPTVEQEEGFDIGYADGVVDEILALHQELESLCEERRTLKHEIVRVDVFGDFDMSDVRYLEEQTGRKMQFYFAKKGADVDVNGDNVLYIGAAHGLDYFIAFNKTPRSYDGMVEMIVEQPVNKLKDRYRAVEDKIHTLTSKITQLGRYNEMLHDAYIKKLNDHQLYSSQNYAENVLENKIFTVEGWVAKNHRKKLKKLLDSQHVHCEEIAIEEDDKIPTEMENLGSNRIGEDLVHIYDIPSIQDKDPSMWVLWAFALFFAIIVGDGGYGLVFLSLGVLINFKMKSMADAGRRFLKLIYILSGACIIWGVLTCSFFGINFAPDSQLRKFSMIDRVVEKKAEYHFGKRDSVYQEWLQKIPTLKEVKSPKSFINKGYTVSDKGQASYDVLNDFSQSVNIEIALLIGMIHIIISLLRYLDRNWAAIGWVLFILGGYLYFPSMLGATSMVYYLLGVDPQSAVQAGLHLIWGGLGLAVLLGIVQNRFSGLLEITNVIQIFSDILSYLRLFALGLSGAMVSSTFNDLGLSVPIIPGILIIVLGHVINIGLCIMSGVIHGLRLNFLEWYHYSFEGGGRLLKPLKLLKR